MRQPVLPFMLLLLTAAVGITGCDNSIKPFDEQNGFYSIYGVLDLYAEANYIRVKNLNNPLSEETSAELDATVTLENMDTGATEMLEDSVVVFDGVYTHNFRVTSPISPGAGYRVTVESPEGNKAFATTRTPDIAEIEVIPGMPDCLTAVDIRFRPVIDWPDLEALAGIEFEEQLYWVHALPAEGETEEEVIITFTPRELAGLIAENNGLDTVPWCHELSDARIYLRYTHYGPDFYGRNESDTTSIPGGVGRFGALYRDTLSFAIDTSNVCFPFC